MLQSLEEECEGIIYLCLILSQKRGNGGHVDAFRASDEFLGEADTDVGDHAHVESAAQNHLKLLNAFTAAVPAVRHQHDWFILPLFVQVFEEVLELTGISPIVLRCEDHEGGCGSHDPAPGLDCWVGIVFWRLDCCGYHGVYNGSGRQRYILHQVGGKDELGNGIGDAVEPRHQPRSQTVAVVGGADASNDQCGRR